jgi:hypothetical protein
MAKQTLEEAADKYFPFAEKIGGETYTAYRGFITGAKWQQEVGQEVGQGVQVVFTEHKDALNLDELESKLDNSLSKETTESLFEWLISKRVDDDLTDDEWLIREKHKETLEFGEWLLANEIEYVDNTTEGNIYIIFGYLDYGSRLTIKDLHEIYLKQNNKLCIKKLN